MKVGREINAEQPPVLWEDIIIPGTPRQGPIVWLKRTFELASKDRFCHYNLHFGMANFECKVLINGMSAGDHFGGFTPFNFDITPFVHSGTNILLVRVTDDRAIQGDYRIGAGLVLPASSTKAYIAPAGSTTGLWGIVDSVELRVYPQVHISDIYVKSSVKDEILYAEITIRNTSQNMSSPPIYRFGKTTFPDY